MPDSLKTAASALVHVFVALVLSVLLAHGIDIPAGWALLVQTAILGLIVAAYIWGMHWLSTRSDATVWGRIALVLAKVLTVGLGALTTANRTVPSGAKSIRGSTARP